MGAKINKVKIIQNTASYYDNLTASLKKLKQGGLYLSITMEEYQEGW